MSSSVQTAVKQLANRLETASLTERLDALQELQSLSRTEAHLVGQVSLQKVIDLLKEQSDVEEYQEALDLIHRLVTSRDHSISRGNVGLFLDHAGNVELLLDLLEHEDPTVGVMTSQILTEIHSKDGLTLEKQIHACPAGMNKLLQRLPDSSREEVRNQAIVLVQQLTVKNEEMKKTVVFNEGFELLFGIIKSEGGSNDSGLVIKDCLQICNNILTESETCQRLFYGMGGDWIMNLSDFFDPVTLEAINLESSLDDSKLDDAGGNLGCWFQQPTRKECAILALDTIAKSLHIPNPKHQNIVGMSISTIIPSASFWIGRKGPAEVVDISLELLSNVICSNAFIAQHLYSTTVRFTPPEKGVSIPIDVKEASLTFGWRPLPNDERKIITVPALLAERYVYSSAAWTAASSSSSSRNSSGSSIGSEFNSSAVDGLSQGCLLVFERVLLADPSISYLTIQQILAPIPLDEEESEGGDTLENAKPLGAQLLTLLAEGSSKIIATGSNIGISSSTTTRSEIETFERCANLFALLFVHGGSLSRELSSAITTAHTSTAYSSRGPHEALLPYLLSVAGAAAKLQSPPGAGHTIIIALLRMLAASCCECVRCSLLILSDPSNLFVVDFATLSSENAGVPAAVQIMSCLFLGCIFLTLPSADPSSSSSSDQHNVLSRKSFLGMIDSRIGLNRFTDMLRRPVKANGVHVASKALSDSIFLTPGYKAFYEKQVEMIVAGIFEFYSGDATVGDAASSVERQIIDSQNKVIGELREHISALEKKVVDATTSRTVNVNSDSSRETQTLRDEVIALQQTLTERDSCVSDMMRTEALLSSELQAALSGREELEVTLRETQNLYLNSTKQQSDDNSSSRLADENLMLKETILLQDKDLKYVQGELEQRDRKIQLIEEELRSPVPQQSHELMERGKKIAELESRNAELMQQLWAAQTDINTQKAVAANSQIDATNGILKDILPTIVALAGVVGVDIDSSSDLLLSSSYLVKSLQDCVDSIYFSAGTSSDIAEAVGITNLEGKEGTVRRMLSCAEKLREYTQIDMDAANARVEELETEVFNKDFTITELGTSCEELTDSVNTLKAELERARTSFADSRSQIEVLSEKLNNSSASNDDSIKTLRAQLTKVTQESTMNKSEAVAFKSQADALREQTTQLEAEVLSMKEQVASRNNRGDLLVLEGEIARLVREAAEKESRFQQQLEELSRLARDSAEKESYLQQQQEEISRLLSNLNEQSELLLGREGDLQASSASLNAAKEELASLRWELEDCKAAVDREGRAARDLSAQKASLEAASASREREYGELNRFMETTVAWLHKKNNANPFSSSSTSSSSNSDAMIASFREAMELFGRRHEEELSSVKKGLAAAQQQQQAASAALAVDPRAALFPKTPAKDVSIINASGTPSYISGTGNRELARLHNELNRERRRLFEVQENMSDMLSLLAQQETELTVFRGSLEGFGGAHAVYDAEEHARRLVAEKYGSYIDFRNETSGTDNSSKRGGLSGTYSGAGNNNGDQSLDMSIWN